MKHWKPTPVLRRRFEFDKKGVPLLVWVLGLVLLATFTEVWQATRVSELTLGIDRTEAALSQAASRQSYLESQLAATRTRPALAMLARQLGMKPAEPSQVVIVPAAYLAGNEVPESSARTLVAFGRRVAEVLVPSARARSRR
jgi:hypothetical protein